MEEQKERIEALFRSNDKEMHKLGVKMCHALRITYYILKLGTQPQKFGGIHELHYSLDRDVVKDIYCLSKYMGRIYEIKLKSENGTVENEQ